MVVGAAGACNFQEHVLPHSQLAWVQATPSNESHPVVPSGPVGAQQPSAKAPVRLAPEPAHPLLSSHFAADATRCSGWGQARVASVVLPTEAVS